MFFVVYNWHLPVLGEQSTIQERIWEDFIFELNQVLLAILTLGYLLVFHIVVVKVTGGSDSTNDEGYTWPEKTKTKQNESKNIESDE